MYCAAKYANIEAKTATGERAKTCSKTTLSTGEASMAGTALASKIIPIENTEANIPAPTIALAFLAP